MNEHFNRVNHKYRFKTYNIKTQKIGKSKFTTTKNGVGFFDDKNENLFVIHKYNFYWLRKIIWNFILWYKRPKRKTSNTAINNNIISTISKETWSIFKGVLIVIIGAIILYLYRDNIIEFFNL